ncbi:MAG TPA: hypothetical protein VGF67_12945 [Ktedonobacteraceae bacterium]|jgi:hypothetical protein
MNEIGQASSGEFHTQAREPCTCLPLFPTAGASAQVRQGTPVAPALAHALQAALPAYFPRTTPLSLLLLHITQFEHPPMPPAAPVLPQRLRYHAPAGLLGQVIQIVRRSLRANDQILMDEHGSGAVLLFPEVDQEAMARIAGRVSTGIQLLQAETVIPPLYAETEFVLSGASCPLPAASSAALCACCDQIWECITLRPAVLSPPAPHPGDDPCSHNACGIPFMQIPTRLPARFQQLIPHALALRLRCAPVGRDHNRLMVAMANPTDLQAISHLCAVTGLAIFPVACELSALETLLASSW